MEIKCPPPPPPLPPPPPPPTSPSAPLLQSPNLQLLLENSKDKNYLEEEDLDRAIDVISSHDNLRVFYVSNTLLQPQLQKGSTCGLVALSIASLISQKFVGVEKIFEEAALKGFSKQGEMFSAQSLADLAEKCCKFNSRVISGGMKNHFLCILQSLLNKNLILIPYDCDVNHSPCLKNGTKAHWAVISGFVIMMQPEENDASYRDSLVLLKDNFNECDCDTVESNFNDETDNNLVFYNYNEKLFASKKFVEDISNFNSVGASKVFLIALQGKSRHFGIWEFNSLAESNDNLVQFSDERDSELYILPTGGLEQGLKGQAIILEPRK